MINFQFFPRSHGLTPEMKSIVDCFVAVDANKNANAHLKSNDMLALLRPHLEMLHFSVETGKKKEEKIDVPVLFGENNTVDKSFFADALSADGRTVIEVEAGRAVRNNQFLVEYKRGREVKTSFRHAVCDLSEGLIDMNFMDMEDPVECNHRFREILRGMKIDDPGDYLPSLPQYFMNGKPKK